MENTSLRHEEPSQLRQDEPKEKSILLGILGAAIAGFIGMMVWYYLIKWTGYEIGYAAWGVGFLTGVGARVVGCKGSAPLGIFAGICALLAIVGGQYLAAKAGADEYFAEASRDSYDNRMAYAKDALVVKTDAELKAFLAQARADEEEVNVETIQISDEDIKAFRDTEMPLLQDFVNGKPTRAEFENSIKAFTNTTSFNFMLLKESMGLFTLLWLFLGVGSAFKIASGASGD